MDQFVGHLRDDSTVHDLLIARRPAARSAPPRDALDAAEEALIERDDHDDADGVRHGDRRLRRRRRLRARDALGPVHGRGPRRPVRARASTASSRRSQRRRAEAARARGAAARTRPGAAARRARQLPRRARQALARGRAARDAEDRAAVSARPRAAGARRRPHHHARARAAPATRRGCTAAASRTYHQARDDRMDRLDELRRRWDEQHAKLKHAGRDPQGEGDRERRLRVALPRRPDPAAQVRGGRPAAGAPARAGPRACACAARAPASARVVCRAARADRADAAVRRSRSGSATASACSARTARASRTSCGCSRAAARDPDATARPRHVDRRRRSTPVAAHRARRSSAPGSCPGWFAQTHEHPEFVGRTLLEILHRGDDNRAGLPREAASSRPRPLRARRAGRADLRVASAAGSRRGCRSCCSSSRARRCCCSTSRPTTSTWSRPRRCRMRSDALRGHGARGHPRPLVRALVRPVPGVRPGRRRLRVGRAGLGRGAAGRAAPGTPQGP